MGSMIIDGIRVEFTDETNVLTVIRKAGIDLPTLCYVSELSVYGACRLCTVKDDEGRYFASCTVKPRDGMNIETNTPELRRYRRTLLELLLASHDRDCTTCNKNGDCHLQNLAERMGVRGVRFKSVQEHHEVDNSSNCIVRTPSKCILCGDCVRMCDNIQAVDALDFAGKGVATLVTPAYNRRLAETDCVGCGQCRVVCPTGAISIKNNVDDVWAALADPETRVVAQVAPAVRTAIGDRFGFPAGNFFLYKQGGNYSENGKLLAAMQYIHDHSDEDIGMAQVANSVSLNCNYFSSMFKSQLGVNFILLILQNAEDSRFPPDTHPARRRNVSILQKAFDFPQTVSIQIALRDLANDLCLLGDNLRFSVRSLPVSQKPVIPKYKQSLPVTHSDSLRDVSADGFALGLRERAQAGQNHLAVHVGGIDVFLFKDDSNTPAFQHPDVPDAVQRVSCKPGDGFGQNHVDFPAFAQRDHFIELRSLPRTDTGDSLIGENPCKLPFWIIANFLRVVLDLYLKAVLLLLFFRADTAIGGNSQPASGFSNVMENRVCRYFCYLFL